jgi:lauroyl/myristoyl acyltransferase
MVADVPFGEEGQPVSLAGHKTRAPRGPWVIAQRAKALVFPCFMIRTAPGRYTAKIHNPIDAGAAGITVADMMSDYLNHLMGYLTAYPEQWGLLSPFWERTNANN